MEEDFLANEFWRDINNSIINEDTLKEKLDNFRRNEINYKISMFNPQNNGVRYLKTLIYNLMINKSDKELQKLKNINKIDYGNPYTIKIKNIKIDLDYYQALEELLFIEKKFDFNNSKVLEIGAGYGRTPHMLISNHDIKSYTILDLKDTLSISKYYLKNVLTDEEYNKITFIAVEELDLSNLQNYDLVINIDSFAEMDKQVVLKYLKLISDRSIYFYTKNPVGKYIDSSLDQHSQGYKLVEQALQNGILTNVLDIDCFEDIQEHSKNFIKAYKPSNDFTILDSSWAKPFTYYWQVIYKKDN